jgi:hypothetical protein
MLSRSTLVAVSPEPEVLVDHAATVYALSLDANTESRRSVRTDGLPSAPWFVMDNAACSGADTELSHEIGSPHSAITFPPRLRLIGIVEFLT